MKQPLNTKMKINHETKIKYGIDHARASKTRSQIKKSPKNLKWSAKMDGLRWNPSQSKCKNHERRNGKLFIKVK